MVYIDPINIKKDAIIDCHGLYINMKFGLLFECHNNTTYCKRRLHHHQLNHLLYTFYQGTLIYYVEYTRVTAQLVVLCT